MVICYTTKENINHYTTDFDNIDRFTEEHPYATIWYAFNEKDDVSSSNVDLTINIISYLVINIHLLTVFSASLEARSNFFYSQVL